MTASEPPALEFDSVTAGYGSVEVLTDVSFTVPAGKLVALLGPNGAGKTTTLLTAAGLLRPASGHVRVFGTASDRLRAHQRARQGVCLIPEGRGIFRSLTVRENLRLQSHAAHGAGAAGIDVALTAFPALKGHLNQYAGLLSGGQQQMLALARAYLSRPRLILLDEVSLGLAPQVIDEIFTALETLAASGISMLLVEQYVTRALAIAHAVILLDHGTVTYSGPPSGLDEKAVLEGYLGISEGREGVPPSAAELVGEISNVPWDG
jgi:branched-chain amino acid transport system ATP-binding protein